jgi:hypothetical protein
LPLAFAPISFAFVISSLGTGLLGARFNNLKGTLLSSLMTETTGFSTGAAFFTGFAAAFSGNDR